MLAQYREVLVLRELEQMPYREIASLAGISLDAVTSRLSPARQQLELNLSD
jgi:RNA polymerase sigma-70 factor (ECF subfamily)